MNGPVVPRSLAMRTTDAVANQVDNSTEVDLFGTGSYGLHTAELRYWDSTASMSHAGAFHNISPQI